MNKLITVLLTICMSSSVFAWGQYKKPQISEVFVNQEDNELTIRGSDFQNPDVSLGEYVGFLTFVTSTGDHEWVVELPTDIMDGDYKLTLSQGWRGYYRDDYDLTIGADGVSLDKDGIEDLVGKHTVDTSAATECSAGEVFVADGFGGGVCLPLAPLLGGPMSPVASACPCRFLEALSPHHTWDFDTIDCKSGDTPPTGTDSGFIRLNEHLTDTPSDEMITVQNGPEYGSTALEVVCRYMRSGVGHQFKVADGDELSDCFEDIQTVAIALGVSCPASPVFKPQK